MNMKTYISEFFRRGISACGLGPIVLAIVYFMLNQRPAIEVLTVNQVCTGIISLSALSFVAGGMNIIYHIEKLPLMVAVFIHGCVLYIGYLLTYIVNGWLEQGLTPVLLFTGIFITGYLLIWAVIYSLTLRNTTELNKKLKQKQFTDKNK